MTDDGMAKWHHLSASRLKAQAVAWLATASHHSFPWSVLSQTLLSSSHAQERGAGTGTQAYLSAQGRVQGEARAAARGGAGSVSGCGRHQATGAQLTECSAELDHLLTHMVECVNLGSEWRLGVTAHQCHSEARIAAERRPIMTSSNRWLGVSEVSLLEAEHPRMACTCKEETEQRWQRVRDSGGRTAGAAHAQTYTYS